MSRLYSAFARRVITSVCLLFLLACSKDLPLPEGVDREARPQIVVKQGDIFIDGRKINVRKSEVPDWVRLLGESTFTEEHYRQWNELGLMLKAPVFDGKAKVDVFRVFLRRDSKWDRYNLLEDSPFKHARPTGTFKGYLEIDGIPIGANMTRGELNRWRKKLDLEPLRVDRDLGHYYVYEAGRWTQQYYFDGDGPLIYIEFL